MSPTPSLVGHFVVEHAALALTTRQVSREQVEHALTPTKQQRTILIVICAYVLGILILWNIPYVNIVLLPFKLVTVALHEFCHAAAGLCTGAKIKSITIDPDEGGLTLQSVGHCRRHGQAQGQRKRRNQVCAKDTLQLAILRCSLAAGCAGLSGSSYSAWACVFKTQTWINRHLIVSTRGLQDQGLLFSGHFSVLNSYLICCSDLFLNPYCTSRLYKRDIVLRNGNRRAAGRAVA